MFENFVEDVISFVSNSKNDAIHVESDMIMEWYKRHCDDTIPKKNLFVKLDNYFKTMADEKEIKYEWIIRPIKWSGNKGKKTGWSFNYVPLQQIYNLPPSPYAPFASLIESDIIVKKLAERLKNEYIDTPDLRLIMAERFGFSK
jgi:hypothetical protein